MKTALFRIFSALIVSFAISGCASNRIYSWGGYDDLLYAGYKAPGQMTVSRAKLEAHVMSLRASGQRVPPGIYAELGTLFLQTGDKAKAISFYQLEHDTWPESRFFMSALIANLSKDTKEPSSDSK